MLLANQCLTEGITFWHKINVSFEINFREKNFFKDVHIILDGTS